MARSRYRVAKGGPFEDETIIADRWYIDPSGALVFTNQVPNPAHPDMTVLVQAYASGRWVEVFRVQGESLNG